MLYLIIATICFSLSFGLINAQLSGLPSEFVVFSRLAIATIIFLPFFRFKNYKKILISFFIGIIQFGIMYSCVIKAFKYFQGNEVAILTTTTPLFVAIWSAFLGEKFKPIYLLCIIFSVIGAGIIVWNNVPFNMIVKGVLLMETANCTFALGQVLWKKYIGNSNDINLMATAYLGATLFALPFFLGINYTNLNLTSSQLLSILYLAIIPTGLGYFLWNKGAKTVSYSTLAVMNNLKIPVGVMFAIFIFHEKIDLLNFITGSAIIITAIIISRYKKLTQKINEYKIK